MPRVAPREVAEIPDEVSLIEVSGGERHAGPVALRCTVEETEGTAEAEDPAQGARRETDLVSQPTLEGPYAHAELPGESLQRRSLPGA